MCIWCTGSVGHTGSTGVKGFRGPVGSPGATGARGQVINGRVKRQAGCPGKLQCRVNLISK